MPWSQLPAAVAAEHFQVNPHTGLSSGEAARRLKEKVIMSWQKKENFSLGLIFNAI